MNRCEGQELILDEKTENIIELNNGQQLEAKIEKTKFKLPLMFPKNLDEDSINQRVEDGLKAEKAAKNGEDFEGKEESGENVAVSFKGSIVLSKHVDLTEGAVFSKKNFVKSYLCKHHFFFKLKGSSDWFI